MHGHNVHTDTRNAGVRERVAVRRDSVPRAATEIM